MELTALLILILATWRISNLIVDDNEDGPWELLPRLRYVAGVRYDDKSRPYGTNVVARAILCIWCTSFWVGVILTVGVVTSASLSAGLWSPFVYLMLPFALSGGALVTRAFMFGKNNG